MEKSSNYTGEFVNRVTNTDIGITITTTVLSMLGSIWIILFNGRKWLRNGYLKETRKLLIYLTISDFFIAIGYFTGAIRYIKGGDSNRVKVLECDSERDIGCIIQSFITTLGSLWSFFWTTVIAFHLFVNYEKAMDHPEKSKKVQENKSGCRFRLRWLYHFSWLIPVIILSIAAGTNVLGSDLSVGSGAWCWISACLLPNLRTFWMTFTGKGWEILMYLLCCLFYSGLKIRKMDLQKRNHKALKLQKLTPLTDPRYRNTTNADEEETQHIKSNSNENMKYLYIWLIEVCLRMPGTIRYIMADHKRHTGYSSAYDNVDIYFLHFQCFGDSAQAFCSWVNLPSIDENIFDPIGCYILLKLKEKIWKGEFIDLSLLIKSPRELANFPDQDGDIVVKGGICGLNLCDVAQYPISTLGQAL
ncbi:GPR157 [Mytilus coruscus]|uniref:GPR157 n=1 Tax=Mytilus coruscus TaxID=42192 RepID=A0A6J8CZG8_MYTCO|nr:GPR157 [Mytilus coruscus]